jgi:hypothetical protein
MKILRWFVINALFAVAMVAGELHGVWWAWNLFAFALWSGVVVTVLLVFAPKAMLIKLRDERGLPRWLWGADLAFDLGIVLLLAATGHFVMASGWLFHLMVLQYIRNLKPEEQDT